MNTQDPKLKIILKELNKRNEELKTPYAERIINKMNEGKLKSSEVLQFTFISTPPPSILRFNRNLNISERRQLKRC